MHSTIMGMNAADSRLLLSRLPAVKGTCNIRHQPQMSCCKSTSGRRTTPVGEDGQLDGVTSDAPGLLLLLMLVTILLLLQGLL